MRNDDPYAIKNHEVRKTPVGEKHESICVQEEVWVKEVRQGHGHWLGCFALWFLFFVF